MRNYERSSAPGNSCYLTQYHVVVDGLELPAENKRNAMRVMVQQLVKNVPIEEIRKVVPGNRMVVLPGIHADHESALATFNATFPVSGRPHRYFLEHAFVDSKSNQTYVLSKRWNIQNTEPTMKALADAFSNSGVSSQAQK